MFNIIKTTFQSPPNFTPLLAVVPILPNLQTQVWGPTKAYQYDASGTRIVQHYISLLVRHIEQTEQWYLVRQINSIQNGLEWTSRPIVSEITPESAQQWILENGVEVNPLSPNKPR